MGGKIYLQYPPLDDLTKQIHLPAHKGYDRQHKANSIHDCDWSNPEAFLDILEPSHHHQRFPLTEQGVRGDKGIQFASTLCS